MTMITFKMNKSDYSVSIEVNSIECVLGHDKANTCTIITKSGARFDIAASQADVYKQIVKK